MALFKKKETQNINVKRVLSDTYPEEAFKFVDGFVAKNIHELTSHLAFSEDHVFEHHVNKDEKKNDFANWIGDVLADYEVVKKLNNVFDKKKYTHILEKRIKELELLNVNQYLDKNPELKKAVNNEKPSKNKP